MMTTVSNKQYLWNKRYELKIRVLANRMYQSIRQRRFEFLENIIKSLSIIVGSYAFINIADQLTIQWSVFIITALNVFGFGARGRDSNKRASEWTLLERDIDLVGERDFVEDDLNRWSARCNEIEVGEPKANTVLMEICTKKAHDALGGEYDLQLNCLQKFMPIIFIP